jgi:hypothetical protein
MLECPPPIRANVTRAGLDMDMAALKAALAVLPVGAPVVVMIHGYRFAPDARGNCPHLHILSAHPTQLDRKAISWPRHLGLDGRRGLAIALGWPARGTVSGAYRRAEVAGRALAEIAHAVSLLSAGRPVDVIGHSLGARAALAALPYAAPGTLRRLILLAAAETRRPARAAMNSPAGRAVEVINVTTRENDLFDFCLEWLVGLGFDTAIGQGPGDALPNWLDLQIDQPATRDALAELGHNLAAPRRISHWSPYLRPGIFTLYRALLDGHLPLPLLRAHLPGTSDRRWSRLFALRSPWPATPHAQV